MTDKEFKRLNRAQLIDIIYQFQLQVEKLTARNQALETELADRRLRLRNAGNIADAALEINDCFRSAQNAAEQYLNEIQAIREEAVRRLRALGFEVLPSKTNFVFAKHRTVSGEDIYKGLKARGVLVRHFSDPKITDYCRITIGNEEQMQTLYDKLEELIQQA
jgi:histidinol-phosphate aminotransferase